MRVYLDSSAIVKRYVKEAGSDSVDTIYHALEGSSETDSAIIISSWNLGEAYGAIDTKRTRGDISERGFAEALTLLSQETKKFVAMRRLRIVPVGARALTNSRDLVLKYHIYQADALQIESARLARAQFFVSSDRKLLDCAKAENLEAYNPERDQDLIEAKIRPFEREYSRGN